MLFATNTTRSVMSALDDMGFEQLLALPAVPLHNPRHLRYPVVVRTSVDSGQWCLRSFGTGFDLVDPTRRASLGRWYSVGWGLRGEQESAELLLLHVIQDTPGVADLRDAIEGLLAGTAPRSAIQRGRCGDELRMCAVLDVKPAEVVTR